MPPRGVVEEICVETSEKVHTGISSEEISKEMPWRTRRSDQSTTYRIFEIIIKRVLYGDQGVLCGIYKENLLKTNNI